MSYDSGMDSGTSVWRGDYEARQWARESTAPASALLPSPWLDALWTDARTQGREAVWDALPDRIGDVAEGARVSAADIAFLRDRSADRLGPLPAAAAAVRALGRLCEDDPRWLNDALPAFVNTLQEPVAGLRYAAVEAIWQARAFATIPALAMALRTEHDQTVRVTLEHVLRILR